MRQRIVTPELLDSLPHDAPEAVRNRKEIRFINTLIGGLRWTAATVKQYSAPGIRWMEVGAGDGPLVPYLASVPELDFTGVDLIPRPANWPSCWDWVQGDLFETLGATNDPPQPWNGLVANLVLHHFQESQLRDLGRLLQSFRILVIHEPVRGLLHSLQGYCLYPLGLNHVTRNDMHVSIRAGFRGRELADWLGLSAPQWDVTIRQTFLGSYRLVAVRNER